MLEPCEAKVSRTVLRGERARKGSALPGERIIMRLFRKRTPPQFEKFLPFFNSACVLILTLSTNEDGTPRHFDPENMATSASAVVGAAYVSKKTAILNGHISESEMGPFLDEINSLFQFVAGSCIRERERKEGQTIDLQSKEAQNCVEDLCYSQEEKMARYIGALAKIAAKGPGSSVGADLAVEIQRDIFNDEFPAVLFSMSLLELVAKVK